MMENDSVDKKLDILNKKLDQVLALLEINRASKNFGSKSRGVADRKEKPGPLTEEEIARHAAKFQELFSQWEAGKELEVEGELEAMDTDLLRRFADANNLNVTAKMPRQRVMQLVGGRFRERRQLLRPHFRHENDVG